MLSLGESAFSFFLLRAIGAMYQLSIGDSAHAGSLFLLVYDAQ